MPCGCQRRASPVHLRGGHHCNMIHGEPVFLCPKPCVPYCRSHAGNMLQANECPNRPSPQMPKGTITVLMPYMSPPRCQRSPNTIRGAVPKTHLDCCTTMPACPVPATAHAVPVGFRQSKSHQPSLSPKEPMQVERPPVLAHKASEPRDRTPLSLEPPQQASSPWPTKTSAAIPDLTHRASSPHTGLARGHP
jgi:hypothetical protein